MSDNKKTFLVFEEGEHLYSIFVEDQETGFTAFSLYTSFSDTWNISFKDKHLLSISDTGNGFRFHKELTKLLGYEEFNHLSILVKFISFYQKLGQPAYRVVEQIHLTDL